MNGAEELFDREHFASPEVSEGKETAESLDQQEYEDSLETDAAETAEETQSTLRGLWEKASPAAKNGLENLSRVMQIKIAELNNRYRHIPQEREKRLARFRENLAAWQESQLSPEQSREKLAGFLGETMSGDTRDRQNFEAADELTIPGFGREVAQHRPFTKNENEFTKYRNWVVKNSQGKYFEVSIREDRDLNGNNWHSHVRLWPLEENVYGSLASPSGELVYDSSEESLDLKLNPKTGAVEAITFTEGMGTEAETRGVPEEFHGDVLAQLEDMQVDDRAYNERDAELSGEASTKRILNYERETGESLRRWSHPAWNQETA